MTDLAARVRELENRLNQQDITYAAREAVLLARVDKLLARVDALVSDHDGQREQPEPRPARRRHLHAV